MKEGRSRSPNICNVVSKIGIMLVCLSLIVVSGCRKGKVRGSVRLYTSVPVKIIEAVSSEFEAKHPEITLEVFREGTGKVMKRIRKEGETGNLGADVIWVADFSAAEELKKRGLLQKYASPEAENIIPIFLDDEAYYTGSRLLSMVITYNKRFVKEKPQSYHDLVDPKWKGKVGLVNPETSGSSFFTTATLLQDERFGWQYYKKLHQNECEIVSNNSILTEKIGSGELYFGITIDSTVRKLMEEAPTLPIGYVFPRDGIVLVASPIAITRDCLDPVAARVFVDWVLSQDGQGFLAQKMGTASVRLDIKPPEGMLALQQLKIIPSNAKKIYRDRADVRRIFKDIFSGKRIEDIREKIVEEIFSFGASGSGSPQKIFAQYAAFTEYLGKKLGRRVKLVQKRTYEELNGLFKKGEIAFGRIATGGYIRLKKEIDIEILALVMAHGDPHYKALIIVPKDSPIISFDQLRGKTFAFVDPFSNSGFNYPSYLVAQKGSNIDTFFSRYIFSGGHDKSIMAVFNKIADGASISSTSLLRAETKNPEIRNKIKIIQESPLFFRGPVVVKAEMPQDFKKRLKEILLKMHLDEDGRNALKAMKIDRFIKGKDSDFDTEREILRVVNEDKGKK